MTDNEELIFRLLITEVKRLEGTLQGRDIEIAQLKRIVGQAPPASAPAKVEKVTPPADNFTFAAKQPAAA